MFHKKNEYPLWMINQVMETVRVTTNTRNISTKQLYILDSNNDKLHPLILPYAGPKCNNISQVNESRVWGYKQCGVSPRI